MTNKARSLGNAGENGVVKRIMDWGHGLTAKKQPMSGQLKAYPADVVIKAPRKIRVLVESKVRSLVVSPKGKTTWTIDFNWLRQVMRQAETGDEEGAFDHGALFVRPKSSQEHFVLLSEADYLRLLSR